MKKTLLLGLALTAVTLAANADDPAPAPSKTVKLCDNKTTVQVANDAPKTREEGQKISDALMAQWKETNPNTTWELGEIEAHQVVAPEDNSQLIGTGQSSTYGVVTEPTSSRSARELRWITASASPVIGGPRRQRWLAAAHCNCMSGVHRGFDMRQGCVDPNE